VAAGLVPATPVAIVENASRPDSRVTAGTLANLPALAALRGNGPALIVVGAVCGALAATEMGSAQAEFLLQPLRAVAR
jgi:siroheme synthase